MLTIALILLVIYLLFGITVSWFVAFDTGPFTSFWYGLIWPVFVFWVLTGAE